MSKPVEKPAAPTTRVEDKRHKREVRHVPLPKKATALPRGAGVKPHPPTFTVT